MRDERFQGGAGGTRSATDSRYPQHAVAPGKRTLTEGLVAHRLDVAATPAPGAKVDPGGSTDARSASAPDEAPPVVEARGAPHTPLQLLFGVQRTGQAGTGTSAEIHAAAARGTATPASPLPYAEQLQRAFGRHDISSIKAHLGSDATASAHAIGARAYATGDHVVLGSAADLHTVAHEAAHVIQQRGGVQLSGGVGAVGDPYERHADAVADQVVAGGSAEPLLDRMAPASRAAGAAASGAAIQRNIGEGRAPGTRVTHETFGMGVIDAWDGTVYTVDFKTQHGKKTGIKPEDLNYYCHGTNGQSLPQPGIGGDRDGRGNNLVKTEFESRLAGLVLARPDLTPAVGRVSQAILTYLQTPPTLPEGVAKGLSDHSYGPNNFGSFPKQDSDNDDTRYQHMLKVLAGGMPLQYVLPVHGAFYSRIYSTQPTRKGAPPPREPSIPSLGELTLGKITKDTDLESKLLKTLSNNSILGGDRGRKGGLMKAPPMTGIGITESQDTALEISKEYGLSDPPHTRALETTQPDLRHRYVKEEMMELDIPFVGGVSGTAEYQLRCAVLVGHLSGDAFKEYVLAAAAYYIGGGNHGFHEVMVIASTLGISYTPGDYRSALPRSFLNSDAYDELAKRFPQLLPPREDTHNTNNT